MQISPASSSPAIHQTQPAQTPAKSTSSAPTDTVQLSPQAQAQISGGDVDHDGDSH